MGCWLALAVRDQLRSSLAVALLPLLAYLVLHAARDRVQPNWPAPLYPFLAVCAAVAVEERWRWLASERAGIRATAWAAGTGFVMSGFIYWHAVHPLVLLPPAKDPTSQMRGWPELAREVEGMRRSAGACWIATLSYATTGQLSFALSPGTAVVQLTERIRYAHLPDVDDRLFGCPGLLVDLERRASLDMLMKRFGDITALGRITRKYQGVPIATYAVFRLANPKGPVLSDDVP